MRPNFIKSQQTFYFISIVNDINLKQSDDSDNGCISHNNAIGILEETSTIKTA